MMPLNLKLMSDLGRFLVAELWLLKLKSSFASQNCFFMTKYETGGILILNFLTLFLYHLSAPLLS